MQIQNQKLKYYDFGWINKIKKKQTKLFEWLTDNTERMVKTMETTADKTLISKIKILWSSVTIREQQVELLVNNKDNTWLTKQLT